MAQPLNEPRYQIEASDFRCASCSTEIPCETAYYSAVFYDEQGFRRKDSCLACWRRETSARACGESGLSAQGTSVGEGGASEGPQIFAFWRTRRPPLPSEQPRRLRFDAEVVLEFFRRLGARDGTPPTETPPTGTPPTGTPPTGTPPTGTPPTGTPPTGTPPTGTPPTGTPPTGTPTGDGLPPDVAPVPVVPSALPSEAEREELRFVLALLLLRKKMLSFLSSQHREGTEWLKLSEKKSEKKGAGRFHWVKNPALTDGQIEKVKDRVGDLLQMRV